jgi:hypothetical protein
MLTEGLYNKNILLIEDKIFYRTTKSICIIIIIIIIARIIIEIKM